MLVLVLGRYREQRDNGKHLFGRNLGRSRWRNILPSIIAYDHEQHHSWKQRRRDRARTASPAISNNIVAFNSSGIYNGSDYYAPGTPILQNNDVYGNTYYDYSGLSADVTDMSADPLFLAPWIADYHLLPGSPCIDAGANAVVVGSTDLDDSARIFPVGGTVELVATSMMPRHIGCKASRRRDRCLRAILSSLETSL